ncbi:hypothetical protein [Myxococcus sp. RHSTA-1-4]|uniref:hypothetical protein n=1 Tax=Myxococcus sp. RHSTA-1-4 TaxID=2874601 RepID=UPI001CBF7E5C|nr:hypothetical protein [Myxococcus sp. RHSTA-1-4]MBZ4416564.1 hypothetical protein [Myxococcus sp. RHSTA-1-4]
MPKRFFKLTDDVYLSGRWELGHPLDQEGQKLDDPWQFRIGQRAHPEERIRIPIKISGRPLDYSHAAFSIPIVHARVAPIFTEVAPDDVQLIPVEIDSQPAQHFILNDIRLVKCIDDAACEEVRYWAPEDGMPEKVGTYSSVSGMRIHGRSSRPAPGGRATGEAGAHGPRARGGRGRAGWRAALVPDDGAPHCCYRTR